MNEYAHIVSPKSITIFKLGAVTETRTVQVEELNTYNRVLDRINEDYLDEAWEEMDVAGLITKASDKITIDGHRVLYEGEELVNHMSERLLDMVGKGIKITPLVNFIEKCMENPSKNSIDQLHKFLEHKNLPITNNGNFLAYKAIRNDWKDKHSGTILNTIGKEVTEKRNRVDDNPAHGCSRGLHAGSLNYVSGFASNYGNEGGDRVVIVEINPADVVSVPDDCNCQKLRTWRYLVVGEYKGLLPEFFVEDYDAYIPDEDDEEGEYYSLDARDYQANDLGGGVPYWY